MRETTEFCCLLLVCILSIALAEAGKDSKGTGHIIADSSSMLMTWTSQVRSGMQVDPKGIRFPVRPPLRKLLGNDVLSLDDLPRNPARDCNVQDANVAASLGACQDMAVGANATCCTTIESTFGASAGQRSSNCLCLKTVLDDFERAAPGFAKVLLSCKSMYGLRTSWASEAGGLCPTLPDINDPYLWQGVAPTTVAFFVVHYLAVSIIEWLFAKFSPVYQGLPLRKQRNVADFTYKILALSFALVWALVFGWDLLVNGHVGSSTNFSNMRLALTATITFYMFELAYRIKHGVPVILHHIVTIALILTVIYTIYDTRGTLQSAIFLRFSLLWLMHALIEQGTDLGMILYHLRSIFAPRVLKAAAIIHATVRLIVHALSWILYFQMVTLQDRSFSNIPWKRAWTVMIPIADIALLLLQGHTLYTLLAIAKRARANLMEDLEKGAAHDAGKI